MFGSVEISEEERIAATPPGFRPESFETIRWRYHASPRNMSRLGYHPKVILNVAALSYKALPHHVVRSVHSPVEQCRNTVVHKIDFNASADQYPVTTNHYLGSWERYSRRTDIRRTRSAHGRRGQLRDGRDDGAALWLRGFVNMVGRADAAELLGGAYLATTRSGRSSRSNSSSNNGGGATATNSKSGARSFLPRSSPVA
jgi:hypothetical protein